jgi:hypothetical protein
MQWLRLYVDVLDDPKVQRLPPDAFKGWVNLLCLAKRCDGALPALADIAFALRLSPAEASELIEILQQNGLLDKSETGMQPHNWNGRQYKSDVSNERVKRHRQRKRNVDGNVTVPVSGNSKETPPATPPEQSRADSDSETEAEKKQTCAVANAPAVTHVKHSAETDLTLPKELDRRKGARLPADFVVPEGWMLSAAESRARNGLPDINYTLEGERFVNHFVAKPGKLGVKIDWRRTFINWCLNFENMNRPQRNGQGPSATETGLDSAFEEVMAEETGGRSVVRS